VAHATEQIPDLASRVAYGIAPMRRWNPLIYDHGLLVSGSWLLVHYLLV